MRRLESLAGARAPIESRLDMWKAESEFITDAEKKIGECLPLFGHRNWIVVTDSAYPAQSKPGIETVVMDANHMHVVGRVFNAISAQRHVKAKVYVDKELAFVAERDAPGVLDYRRELDALSAGNAVTHLPHEQIIHKLDQAAEMFRVLIVKTDGTIPYTSVFFELDCEYWNADAEQRLRQAMLVAETE